ncbi:MAG: hypothetical protein ACE5NA_00195 [Nitrospiraceae bacterium]
MTNRTPKYDRRREMLAALAFAVLVAALLLIWMLFTTPPAYPEACTTNMPDDARRTLHMRHDSLIEHAQRWAEARACALSLPYPIRRVGRQTWRGYYPAETTGTFHRRYLRYLAERERCYTGRGLIPPGSPTSELRIRVVRR